MNRDTFLKTEKLYHYTSFESAIKILVSNKLLFGKLSNLNDINESFRPLFYSSSINHENALKELSKYKQISLAQDGKRKGFAIPSMWGHYAEKGCGVCLVFDKKKLLEHLDKASKSKKVKYTDKYNGDIMVQNENIPLFFEKNRDKLFFKKKKDWDNEQEYRIISKTEDAIDFEDSLMVVIMCFAKDTQFGDTVFNSLNYNILEKILSDIPILELGYWNNNANLRDKDNNSWDEEEINNLLSILENY